MSFFTRAASTALTGLAIFGFASAAFAHHLPAQPYDQYYTEELLSFVQAYGNQVFLDDEVCDEKPGLMGAASPTKQLLVCIDNHKGDNVELADTVRHEVIHLAQFCKGRKYGASLALLYPERQDEYFAAVINHLHWNPMGYPERKWASEAEARALAHLLDEREVAALIYNECEWEVE